MAKILANYKQAFIDEIKDAITANTSQYYAFASHPIAYDAGTPTVDTTTYDSKFIQTWTMLFGKKLAASDIVTVCNNYTWTTNTAYTRFDNTANTLSNSQFYVVTTPEDVGGYYHLFKCIDNSNGAVSTEKPDQIQTTSFTKSDGYTWRYVCSCSTTNYNRFATDDLFPIFANTTVQTDAYNKAGVEVIMIANSGSGYDAHHQGTIQSVVNNSLIQIENVASSDPEFYKNAGIYIYNATTATSQLRVVDSYVSNLSGNWVYLNEVANTDNITSSVTQYRIAPQISIDSDGDDNPKAYCTINTTANSIDTVVVVNAGYGITRANVSVISNTAYGTGANLYPIVPPPGGHGSNPAAELNTQGLAIEFQFANNESNTIPTNVDYNKIGLLKNPFTLTAGNAKGSAYSSNTFSNVIEATITPAATFTTGDYVTGNTSSALGVVAFSNSSHIYLTGDKDFVDGERITSDDGLTTTTISITDIGDIYSKEITPLYVQNIDNLSRANNQSEAFQIIIQV